MTKGSYEPKGWVDGDEPTKDEGSRIGGLHLSDRNMKAILKWMPPEEPFQNVLEQAGYMRNVGRIMTHEGLRVLAFLATEGLLKPGGDPVEAVRDLLDKVESLQQDVRDVEARLYERENP